MKMTGQNILQFNYPRNDSDDSQTAENQFQRALLSAENTFGPLSGEVGLILCAMVEHYKTDPTKADLIASYEKRIEEIVALYMADQKS
jgi:hypothetical protein